MNKTIYISGAISNEPQHKEIFEVAEKKLFNKFPEAKILNPVKFIDEEQKNYREILATCMIYLSTANIIFMIKNWKNSPGAIAELFFAKASKIHVMYESDGWDEEEKITKLFQIAQETGKITQFNNRNENTIMIKKIIILLIREKFTLSYTKIGLYFKNDHSTISHLHHQAEFEKEYYPDFKKYYSQIKNEFEIFENLQNISFF